MMEMVSAHFKILSVVLIYRTHFSFFYLQIRAALKVQGVPNDVKLSEHPLFELIDQLKTRGVVTTLYQCILKNFR